MIKILRDSEKGSTIRDPRNLEEACFWGLKDVEKSFLRAGPVFSRTETAVSAHARTMGRRLAKLPAELNWTAVSGRYGARTSPGKGCEGEKMTSTSGLREQSLGRQSVAMEVAPSRKSNSPDGEQISEVGAYRSVRRLQSCSNASPLLLRLAPRVTRRQKEQGEPAQTRRAHFERAKMTQLSPTPNRRRDGEEAPTSVSWLDATETTPVSTRQQDGRNKPHPSLQIESLAITTLARR